MAKLCCICGETMHNTGSPNEIEGYLITDNDIDFDGEKNCVEIMNIGREVWECPECGRLAFSHPQRDSNTVKWYKPEDGMPGHLMKIIKDNQKKVGVYWCQHHDREATHTDKRGDRCCDPNLGGILMPCHVVFIEDIEIEND